MIKKVIMAASAAAVVASASPVLANPFVQSHEHVARGATATLNLKIPFGPRTATAEPTYGLSFNYGRAAGNPYLDARPLAQAVKLADLRFNGGGELTTARVASFNFAPSGSVQDNGLRSNLFDGPLGWQEYAIIGGAVVLVAILAF